MSDSSAVANLAGDAGQPGPGVGARAAVLAGPGATTTLRDGVTVTVDGSAERVAA